MKKFFMKKLAQVIPIAAICMLTLSASSVSAENNNASLPTFPNTYNKYIQPIVTAFDYFSGNI